MLPAELLVLLETCRDFNSNLFHFVLCCEIIVKEKLESLKISLQIFFTRRDSKIVQYREKIYIERTNNQTPPGHWNYLCLYQSFTADK